MSACAVQRRIRREFANEVSRVTPWVIIWVDPSELRNLAEGRTCWRYYHEPVLAVLPDESVLSVFVSKSEGLRLCLQWQDFLVNVVKYPYHELTWYNSYFTLKVNGLFQMVRSCSHVKYLAYKQCANPWKLRGERSRKPRKQKLRWAVHLSVCFFAT